MQINYNVTGDKRKSLVGAICQGECNPFCVNSMD